MTRLTTARRRTPLLFSVSLLVACFAGTSSVPAQELEPVVIRIASDHSGPPHPSALAQVYFEQRLPEVIPGSELRRYHAGALYTIPEAVEAMAEGNLEMAWGQYGKTGAVDPWMTVITGPMLLTTPGAMNQLDEFETVQKLHERLSENFGVKVLGTSHLSLFMGAGASERLREPEDFTGKKIRSMGPAENATLQQWGASPVVMSFGDVPPALQTGVIDGLLTSLGGFLNVRDQAPYFTVAGINGITGDYYWIGASEQWWNSLNEPTRQALEKLITEEVIPLHKKLNWCNDQRVIEQYQTDDPSKPGIYVLSAEEQEALREALGEASIRWKKENTPDEANEWVDKFVEEARAAVEANPPGTSSLEQTDCSELAHWFES